MTIPENVFIKSAKYVGDYCIAFRFTDGRATELDFHSFLTSPVQNPMATRYLDVTLFKAFAIEDRADIVWGDWEMCFPFAALYAGDLEIDSLGNKQRVSRKPMRHVVTKAQIKELSAIRKAHISGDGKSSPWPEVQKRIRRKLKT